MATKKIKAAGIQPVARVGGEWYFLLGQEKGESGWQDTGKWASFGGRRERGETPLKTAVREGYEESMGFLGDQKKIGRDLRQNGLGFVDAVGVRTYLYEIPFDEGLPERFEAVLQYIEQCRLECPHGMMEKSALRWFSASELAKEVLACRWKRSKLLRYIFSAGFEKMLWQIKKRGK